MLMIQPEELKSDKFKRWSRGRGVDVWAMLYAAATGDLATIKNLADRDANLLRCEYAYRTPMHFAVRENHIEVVRFLIERGQSVLDAGAGTWHASAIAMARDRGNAEMLALLEREVRIRHHIDPRGETVAKLLRERDEAGVKQAISAEPELIHAADHRGNLPIHWAVMTRQFAMIDWLLGHGADINAMRPDGARPFDLTNGDYFYRGWRDVPPDAIRSPDVVAGFLLARGADYDLANAAKFGDVGRVREILGGNPDAVKKLPTYVTYYSGYPLRAAAGKGHLAVVKLLLEHGADPNFPEPGIAPTGGALHSACGGGHLEVARVLLEHGADPNSQIESSGNCVSIAGGRKDIVELLASYGGTLGVPIGSYYGNTEVIASMFAVNPALANDPEGFGYAVEMSREPVVRLYLKTYPPIASKISLHQAPMPMLKMLLAHGGNVHYKNWLAATALHQLASKGDLERATILIDAGADLEAIDDEYCSTPLGWAAERGQLEMVKLLLDRGANVNGSGAGNEWARPLRWAESRGHEAVARVLRERGAI
jgi:ankyrin repeat protein